MSQVAVAALGCPCAGGGTGGQNALGKSPATITTTAKSLGRGVRARGGDKHRWAKLADAEHDVEGRADYPLRSTTDLSGSSDSDDQQWKGRKRSAL